MGMIKLLFVFVGGKTFDGAGRRIGLTISLGGMGISLLVVSIAYFIMDEDVQEDLPSTKATIGVLVGISFYLSFFSIGMGPGAWLIPSEVFSNVIRAKAMSVAACASRVRNNHGEYVFISCQRYWLLGVLSGVEHYVFLGIGLFLDVLA